jgi:copper chaperone CopZ
VTIAIIVGLLAGWAIFGNNGADAITTSEMSDTHDHAGETVDAQWTCSMHPQIMLPEPGDCPIFGMCKERIEKAAVRTKGVKSAVWNVDTHELKLIFDERKTNITTISKSLAAVGHDTKEIKATEEEYNSVHPCCKYRDEDVVKDHEKDKGVKN